MENNIVVLMVNTAVNLGDNITTAKEAVDAITRKRFMPRRNVVADLGNLVSGATNQVEVAMVFLGTGVLKDGLRESVSRGNYATLTEILTAMLNAGSITQAVHDEIVAYYSATAQSIAEQFGASYGQDFTGITTADVTAAIPSLV